MFDQEKPDFKRHEGDEWYDEIRISVVPRYKTSGMSGDEWRTSSKIEIFRKGVLLKERSFGKMHYAADFLPAVLHELADEGFTGSHEQFQRLCFQPGCKEEGVVEYKLKDEFYPTYGDKMPKREWRKDVRRRFCEKHALRGDCGLEDADRNYELVSAPPGWKGNADLGASEAESPSASVHVQINSMEDLPNAIDEARKQRGGARNGD
jgi:hypothetical protein